MWRATWKSLLARKVRLLMSTFAIVLGVAFVAGTLIFTGTLSKSFTAIFASSVGDVVVSPKGASTDDTATDRTVPASVVRRLATAEGAARADGNVSAFGVFVVDQRGKLVGGNGPPGIAVSYNTAPAGHGVEGLTVVSGKPPKGPDEVVLDQRTAKTAGYQVGDTVRLVTSTAQDSLRPRLVGLSDFRGGGSTNGATITMFDTATAQRLFLDGKDAYSDAWVTAADGVSQAELRDQVAALLPAGYTAKTGDQAAKDSASGVMEAISFITLFFGIFGAVAVVVGGFLILNTFSMLVAQRSRELALLRALGAARRQVTRSVLLEAFVLGVVGSTVGLGLGVLVAIGIRALFAGFGLDMSGQPLAFGPLVFAAPYLIGIGITMLAAYLPARRASRIAPVAALRDDQAMPESSLRVRFLAGLGLLVLGVALMVLGLFAGLPKPAYWVGGGILIALIGAVVAGPVIGRPFQAVAAAVFRRLFGQVGGLAGQNALRNPRRTAVTASALMVGLTLVTTMSVIGDSAKASVDKTIRENFQGDLVVSNLVGQRFSPALADRIEKAPGVASVTRFRFVTPRVDGKQQGVNGVDPARLGGAVRLTMVSGSVGDLTDRGVVVGQDRAEKDHLKVGDTVTMTMPGGRRSYDVVGVVEDNPVLSYPFTLSLGALSAGGYRPADSVLFVDKQPGTSTTTLKGTVEDAIGDQPTVTVKDQAGFAAEQRDQFNQLLVLVYAMLALALVIAVLGIVNTLALSVVERTREVGLLRAVGLSRRQMRRAIRLEAVVIAVLGAVLGVVLGLVFGLVLMTSLRDEGLEVISVPVGQLLLVVLGAGVAGVVAAALPARRAARLDVLRAIATE